MQTPRFTATLRAGLFQTPSSAFSADQLYVERSRKQGAVADQAQSITPHLLGPEHARAPRTARDAYSAFLSAVKGALGTDTAGDDLAAYALETYNALCEPGASARTLHSVFGTAPSSSSVGALKQAWQGLQRARASLNLPDPPAAAGHDSDFGDAAAAHAWQPEIPIATEAPLSPRSAILRLCDPSGKLASLSSFARASGSSTDTNGAASSSVAAAKPWGAAFSTQGAGAAAGPTPLRHNAAIDPDSDDEAAGVRRAKASLTWLQELLCGMTGQSPPSRGGDDTVLLLILQVRMHFAKWQSGHCCVRAHLQFAPKFYDRSTCVRSEPVLRSCSLAILTRRWQARHRKSLLLHGKLARMGTFKQVEPSISASCAGADPSVRRRCGGGRAARNPWLRPH